MRSGSGRLVGLLVLVISVAISSAARAQKKSPMLPGSLKKWLNNGPFFSAALENKTVVLYFFEEGSKKAAGAWSSAAKMKKAFDSKPVLFVAVNSGNSRRKVKRVLEKHEIDWPTIVDRHRFFEKKFEFGKISEKQPVQFLVLRPDGTRSSLDSEATVADLKREVGDPSWHISPSEISEKLHPLWRSIEFGRFRESANLFTKFEDARGRIQKDVKNLKDLVHQLAEKQIGKADSLRKKGRTWEAFQLLERSSKHLSDYFHPYDNKASFGRRKLSDADRVRKEQKAFKLLERGQNLLNDPRAGRRKKMKARKILDLVIKKYPNTDASKLARSMKENAK